MGNEDADLALLLATLSPFLHTLHLTTTNDPSDSLVFAAFHEMMATVERNAPNQPLSSLTTLAVRSSAVPKAKQDFSIHLLVPFLRAPRLHTLQVFDVTSCPCVVGDDGYDPISGPIPFCPSLRHFQARHFDVGVDGMQEILQSFPHLSELDVEAYGGELNQEMGLDEIFNEICHRGRDLEKLAWSTFFYVYVDMVEGLPSLTRLRDLTISRKALVGGGDGSNAGGITQAILSRRGDGTLPLMADSLPRSLETLRVLDCACDDDVNTGAVCRLPQFWQGLQDSFLALISDPRMEKLGHIVLEEVRSLKKGGGANVWPFGAGITFTAAGWRTDSDGHTVTLSREA